MSATSLPIITDGTTWPLVVVGLADTPRLREGKLTPDGRQTYASGCILRVVRAGGEVRSDKSASVHVVDPAAVYELGQTYVGEGQIWVQPYTPDGGRSTLSITVERLVPEAAGSTSRRREATA